MPLLRGSWDVWEGEMVTLIGVISDTHGLLRAEAVEALRGVDLIIHAGDIDTPEVIAVLQELAPVAAVRGNCDQGDWAEAYPLWQRVTVQEVAIFVLHDRKELPMHMPESESGFQVLISGHSHSPAIEEKDGVLYLNPGSAGRKRFKLPVTLALLRVEGTGVSAEIVELLPEQH
jgi:putative phosphoesterase